MKNLLICTDFSEASVHAAKYGCVLAKQFKAEKITLLHIYQPVAIPVELPLIPPYHDEERYKESMAKLAALQRELEYMFDLRIPVKLKTEEMAFDENINRICLNEGAEVIVTGTGNESTNEKEFSESNIMDVVQNSRYPIFVVPRQAVIQPVKSVLFACDLAEFSERIPLHLVEKVLDALPVPVFVINVNADERNFSAETPEEIRLMHHVFDRYEAKYAFIDRENITDGILNFADTYAISLVITITKNYSFFQKLFHKSTTQKLIHRSGLPILSLHE